MTSDSKWHDSTLNVSSELKICLASRWSEDTRRTEIISESWCFHVVRCEVYSYVSMVYDLVLISSVNGSLSVDAKRSQSWLV